MKFNFINNWKIDGCWQDITVLRINFQLDDYYKGMTIELFNFIFSIYV